MRSLSTCWLTRLFHNSFRTLDCIVAKCRFMHLIIIPKKSQNFSLLHQTPRMTAKKDGRTDGRTNGHALFHARKNVTSITGLHELRLAIITQYIIVYGVIKRLFALKNSHVHFSKIIDRRTDGRTDGPLWLLGPYEGEKPHGHTHKPQKPHNHTHKPPKPHHEPTLWLFVLCVIAGQRPSHLQIQDFFLSLIMI